MSKDPKVQSRPKRKRGNVKDKRAAKASALQVFAKKYGRKAQKGVEPNDRHFDERIAGRVRRMKAEELDQLLRDGEE
jgi:hypothetical protein